MSMKAKETIKEIIIQNQNRDFSRVHIRETKIPINSDKIVVVSGVRRCGKTYLIFNCIKELLSKGFNKTQILHINFEDERISFQHQELDLIIQAYRELYPDNNLSNVHFFFDEVQNVSGWEKFIRRLFDTISTYIYITGSNSAMLSSDIATSLRGRCINIELFPLSFREFLNFKQIDSDFYDPAKKAKIVNSFTDYIKQGGFPETINSEFQQKILQDYYYVMLYKDLVERYDISNVTTLKYFLNRILLNIGKPFSINKIYNEIKSAGYKVSKDSLYLFADYAENMYFSFRLRKFDYSIIKQEHTERKMFVIDNGLINSLTYQFSDNLGSLLENTIYLHLRSKYPQQALSFFKDKKECDFVVSNKDLPSEIIQVCYNIGSKETMTREVAGIDNAAKTLNLKNGIILSSDVEMETFISPQGIVIDVVPAWKWLLGI